MVAGHEDPIVQRRRLRLELRRMRKTADISQRDVAAEMDWSVSKLIRIENGDVGISPNDLRALLGLYGVHDPERVDELVTLARGARKASWSDFRDVHTHSFLAFLGYESSAWLIRQFEVSVVPGLLQTEEYAAALLAGVGVESDRAERIWQVRQRRQELHERSPAPPQMFFILEETTVRRQTGGPGVMRRQLERLQDMAMMDHVDLRILPFTAGAHPGVFGSFTLLEFEDPSDDLMLFMESGNSTFTSQDNPEDTSRHLESFFQIEDMALSVDESLALVADLHDALTPPHKRATPA